jgi:hypothetical protein
VSPLRSTDIGGRIPVAMSDFPERRVKLTVFLSALLVSGGLGLLLAFLTRDSRRAPSAEEPASRALAERRPGPTAGPGGAGAAPAARAPGPRLAPGVERPAVELVPGRPGYDPAQLTKFVTLENLFSQEPRNEAWAAPVEQALPGIALRDVERLLPGLRIVGVTCKTTTCRFEWAAPAETEKRAPDVMRFLFPGAVAETRAPYHYVALAGGRWIFSDLPAGDPARTLETAIKARKTVIAQARAGGAGGAPSGIPPEAWPQE